MQVAQDKNPTFTQTVLLSIGVAAADRADVIEELRRPFGHVASLLDDIVAYNSVRIPGSFVLEARCRTRAIQLYILFY